MQMGPLKSPRPNSFGVLFYQHHQDIISNEVISVVLKILQGDSLVSCFNSTYIALIPKLHVHSVVTDFRPISLCNVFYKFLYKVLTNRQKPLIDKIISSSQNAFISGRLITDNILIAYELMHSMKYKMRGGMGRMVVKLDMSKAYNHVEQPILEASMKALSFLNQQIHLIMDCMTSVRYSILVNDSLAVASLT